MASFFAKARERAEAAAQQLQAHHSSSSADGNQGSNNSGGSVASSGSNFTYTGSVPHILRQGLAAVDPRYESNRQFHLLSQAVKSLNIDHEAAARESKGLAKATYTWGQSHLPEKREDSVGDEMLVDITDRLAYIWHEIGQLEAAHSQRAEKARYKLKQFEKSEMDLSSRRAVRNKLRKELFALIPERATASGNSKALELEKQLQQLIEDDQADEEDLSRLKRKSVKDGYNAMFDSLIELGEKMALAARYGKLIANEMSADKSPFPATIKPRSETIPLWQGATRTADIRAAASAALAAYTKDETLPTVQSPPASNTSSLGRADTVSFGISHRTDLDREEQVPTPASVHPSTLPLQEATKPGRASFSSDQGVSMDRPSTSDNQSPSHGLNLSPAVIPAPDLPPRPQGGTHIAQVENARSPTSPRNNPVSLEPTENSTQLDEFDKSPPGPTIAETGVVPCGPGGPSSGTLRPRRSSANPRSASMSAGAVAYLGPPGTYTHQAALKLFDGNSVNLIPMQSITGAIDFVRRGMPGNAKLAVVPIENSTFGPVQDTLDSLLGVSGGRPTVNTSQGSKIYVIGETSLAVRHALLCGPKTFNHLLQLQGDADPSLPIRDDTLSKITNIISHEQALGQCSLFLARYLPQARRKAVESTAAAASTVMEFEAGTAPGVSPTSVSHAHESLGLAPLSLVVAIAPETTVNANGLRVLRSKIQDVKENQTRFFVLSNQPVEELIASHTLPGSLSKLYNSSVPVHRMVRALLQVYDPLTLDLLVGSSAQGECSIAVNRVVNELGKISELVIRKIDRRPAAHYAFSTPSSVWKASYLFEVQYSAASASEIERQIKQIAENMSAAPLLGNTSQQASFNYLGSWRLDPDPLSGSSAEAIGSSDQPLLPAQGTLASSTSEISDLTTSDHVYSSGLGSGPSSSLLSGLSTYAHSPGPNLNDRERKELEAKQEAEEVRQHAEQARFRNQEPVQLYGPQQQNVERLQGLRESQDEGGLDEDESLPAYQPVDPSGQGQHL